ncbi:DUF2071 domain-containing protein [Actinoplanes palleronii]|uniref:DUF2071 domain-containing protein n=1 Tax=Actinoplanes palleronii TaxID=113570 RepID=A0ABQ4BLW6_9ACTN|nr:DUF2071 domain-containing protein [Actinoplanes palleronii]GIE71671.1 hypothetical protein Apa02nite_077790 [Actinoplanes palleronii]
MSVIERRLLVNYRTDPETTARLLPAPLRPQVVNGWAVAGICLIRLAGVRPPGLPAPVGLRSENGAHRIAVEWDTPGGVAHGVYIPRRDTGSRLNAWAGGRVFPGHHRLSRFDVQENPDALRIAFRDAEVHVRTTAALTGSRLFDDLDQASEFFRRGAAGFSSTPDPHRLDGLELRTPDWRVTPVELTSVRSTFFDDPVRFPPGSALPDCGLLMRDVAASWHPLPPMAVLPAGPAHERLRGPVRAEGLRRGVHGEHPLVAE